MPRSAEQKAADEALREAIWGVIKLMRPAPGIGEEEESPEAAGVLTKFMVLAVQVRFDDDGDPTDSLNILYNDGSMLSLEAEGILKMADRTFAGGAMRRTHGNFEES